MYPPSSSNAPSGGDYERERPHAPVRRASRGRDARWRLPTPSQWLLLAGGALIVVGSALPWWSLILPSGIGIGRVELALAGWTTAGGKVVAVLGAITLLLALLRVLRVPLLGALAPHERIVYLALGGEALLLALLALLDGVHVFSAGGYIGASSGIGLYLALAGGIAVIAGGWLHQADAAWML